MSEQGMATGYQMEQGRISHFLPRLPADVPADLTRASARYRRHAWLAVLGLLLFVALYVGLAGWFTWTAYRCFSDLLHGGKNALLDVLGGGASALLALFLLKALFFIKPGGKDDELEITAQEQPEVFAYVHALADRARAPRPHRVFVSNRVNAAVFYDLSLINLIFPSKKNLEIGLGLVNTLNLSEFSAVLAHELGHFAQRSMAVGRWVYMAQQIAGQVVATRDWLDRALVAISSIDIRVAWIGWLLRIIVWSIRSLLDTVFGLVIIAQRALSREMEFQADLVSVSLTGSDALIHALHRLAAADGAWSSAVGVAASELGKGRAVPDVFTLQSHVIAHMGRILNEPGHGASPLPPGGLRPDHRVFEQALAEPPRMWSTHPANRDREDNAKRVYVAAELDERSAWQLFRDPGELRRRATARLLDVSGTTKTPQPMSDAEALQAVERRFGRLFLNPRYRGAYLGRSIVLPHKSRDELYAELVPAEQLPASLTGLYPEPLADDLRDLRARSEEKASLEALRDGLLQAPGGVIRHRGRIIPRRELSAALQQVSAEVEAVRTRVERHDRICRGVHRSAARALGQGWEEYLYGLAATLHYAGHAEANLADARGLVANVFAIVTADGRVSSSERARLISACHELYRALREVFVHADEVRLPQGMLARLLDAPHLHSDDEKRATSWAELLPQDFELPAPDSDNLPRWLQVVDSWVDGALACLDLLERSSLELLLEAEEQVARSYLQGQHPGPAPEFPVVPSRYATLARGQERERQKRLGLWDRFQTADGPLPALARFAVAGTILAFVLGFSGGFARSSVAVYNGLGTSVVVEMDGKTLELAPFESKTLALDGIGSVEVTAKHRSGGTIERFEATIETGPRYVYNVAGASPLVEWSAVYGRGAAVPPSRLGAERWTTSRADHLFEEPPKSLKGSDGTKRVVLSGEGELAPTRALAHLEREIDQRRVIHAHAEWDDADSPFLVGWLQQAAMLPDGAAVLSRRLRRDPLDVAALRAQQDLANSAEKPAVCAQQASLARSAPGNVDLQYLGVRCGDDGAPKTEAYLDGHRAHPQHPFFALAAGYELLERGRWQEAMAALNVAVHGFPSLAEGVRLEQARALRLLGTWSPADHEHWLTASPRLGSLVALETGEDVSGPLTAYSLLAQGKLTSAVETASGEQRTHDRVLRLAAASDGASDELVERALALSDDAGVDGDTIWPSIALAARHRKSHAALDERAKQLDPYVATRVLDLVRGGALLDPKLVDRMLEGLEPAQRGSVCVAAAVLLADTAPREARELAQRLLFAPERPYFR